MLYTYKKCPYNKNILLYKDGDFMEDEYMTLDELKQVNIDYYVNLLRIKKSEQSTNEEVDYQIRVQENKLHALGINTEDFKL